MKSSSIGLLHIPGAARLPGSTPAPPSAQDKLEKGGHVCLSPSNLLDLVQNALLPSSQHLKQLVLNVRTM